MSNSVEAIKMEYEKIWRERSTVDELEEVEEKYRHLELSGCIETVDCAGWWLEVV